MELSVFNRTGNETGRTVSLADDVFGGDPNDHAIYLDVKHYLAAQRQGTHKSKERAEINLTTKKLKKQKGTGGARAGSKKSPVFVGGGRAFGPRPRDYSFKLNKKVKTLARRSAVIYKLRDNAITVLEPFTMEKPSTKQYIDFLAKFELGDKKTILLVPAVDKNLYLSSRNLQKAKVMPVSNINTYEILHADRLIVAESSLEQLHTLLVRD
jgi:large subunit ribosomal protein L4